MNVFRVDFGAFYSFNSIFTNTVNFSSPDLNIFSFFNTYSDKIVSRTFPQVSTPPHPRQAYWSHLELFLKYILENVSALNLYFMCHPIWPAYIVIVQYIHVITPLKQSKVKLYPSPWTYHSIFFIIDTLSALGLGVISKTIMSLFILNL